MSFWEAYGMTGVFLWLFRMIDEFSMAVKRMTSIENDVGKNKVENENFHLLVFVMLCVNVVKV